MLAARAPQATKTGFQYRLSLNAGQKYCRMLQGEEQGEEHSAIRSTFIKLPFSIKTFVLSVLSGHLRHVLLYCNHLNSRVSWLFYWYCILVFICYTSIYLCSDFVF